MSAQIAHEQSFPASCKRCGGVLYDFVDFCPYCGTGRPLDTVTLGTFPKATLSALGPTAAAPPVPATAGLSSDGESAAELAAAYADYPSDFPPTRETPFWHPGRWVFTKGFLLILFIIPIGYAAYLLFGEGRKPAPMINDQGVHETAGSISSPSAPQQANTAPPAAETPPPAAAQATQETSQFKDLPESLRAARASLAENNLTGAEAADNAALARDANNEDARAIQRDLQARQQRRDRALQIADRCAGEGTWSCAQLEASEALAIDSSSQHAQSLMEQAIVAKGWTPLSPPNPSNNAAHATEGAPLPPGANGVRLPSSQDWNAAAPPPLPNAAQATVTANPVNPTDTAGAAMPASNGNSAEAQERAIVQYGWKHPAPGGAAH
jgi:hypothetical protein